ncbi:MAG: N-formylglutamate amidohydrolase [Pseudomonadota bacterium]
MTSAPLPQNDAFEIDGADRPGPALILCDHASNRVPPEIGDLGLSAADMARHIAFDIGAADVARALGRALAAPVILSRFSRLVIDPNRGADDPTLVMKLYDGSIIPKNRLVTPDDIAGRQAAYYTPYHDAIATQITTMIAAGRVPHLLSLHSFTPQLRGRPQRPWHVGILWDRDDRLAGPLIARLRGDDGLVVGDNAPYSGQLQGDTMYQHGTARGLPHVLIELRNDLISTEGAAETWAARLAHHIAPLIPVAAQKGPANGPTNRN